MGAKNDGKYSRAPRLEDLVHLCQYLNDEGAAYVIIGGFAMILHGYTRGTMDIDLLIDPTPSNVAKIKKAMSRLPDNIAAEITDTDVSNYQVVRISDEFVVDLLAKACGIDFKQASSHVVSQIIEGVKIPFADEEILLRMKETPRPKDQQDVLFLKHKK